MKSVLRHLNWFPCTSHILNTILSNTFKRLTEYAILDEYCSSTSMRQTLIVRFRMKRCSVRMKSL